MITFNGITKTMTVNAGVSQVSVRADIYSGWKRWVKQADNAKFPQALRVIGGDPVSGGQTAGDLYFLMNGWRVVIPHRVYVNGALFHDDASIDPFDVLPGGGVTSVVSALVQTVNTAGGSSDAPSLGQITSALAPQFTALATAVAQLGALVEDARDEVLDGIEDAQPMPPVDYAPMFDALAELVNEVNSQLQVIASRPDPAPVDLTPVVKGLKDVQALVIAMAS